MTKSEGLAAARDYVDAMIAINRRYGPAHNVTKELYNEVVQQVEVSSRRLVELQGRVVLAEREKALVE